MEMAGRWCETIVGFVMNSMPHKELEAESAEMQYDKQRQLFVSLLQLKGGWRANHAPQRTAASGSRFNSCALWPPSLTYI
jgi:hypothetical protein